ncbi:bifunctional diguanylate cyclase/phosphodiesterase [Roseomonas sp. 18066]|uniref:putative bifunctional diguanylate cyclase/phosphodiesterase n=1 Tax=Roseomonas sp. 18066 TaxID=2681412 RepID=UPI00135A6B42|nr:EAL domain-containing protein [Roseomonas sp. 18066]
MPQRDRAKGEKPVGILRHRAVADALVLLVIAVVLSSLAIHYEVFDAAHAYSHQHEQLQLDEIFVILVVTGWCSFVYAIRRLLDVLRERRERLRAEGDASWLAVHDPLTRLPNRRGLEQRLERPSPIVGGALYIDLDGFRAINELHGHALGDALLAEVALRLRQLFPSAWLGHPGGDEFVVVFEGVALPVMQQHAVRAMRTLTRPARLQGQRVEVGVSIGLAALPQHGETLRAVLACAETAMQAAKQESRNALRVFEPSMSERQANRAWIEQALREAVQNEVIAPRYQPQVDLKTGHLAGFEALARWRAEDGKMVPPDIFIATAERLGMIDRLSEQLLKRACRDAALWPAPLRLAFNLSPLQLSDPRLAERIIAIIHEAGLAPERLEVEITEGALIREAAVAQDTLDMLRAAGVRVALDDFGTGYASLSQLARFSFDMIKIDRSFIRRMVAEEKQLKIVKSILGLGQGLGIEITAEGVEEAEQAELLRSLGCHIGQGYLFGAAISPEEAAVLASRKGEIVLAA